MNKQDWTLLLVRGFGLYLLMQALFSIPPFLGLGYVLCQTWEPKLPTGELSSLAERLHTELITQGISGMARVLLYGAAGFYLVRSTSVLRMLGIPEGISGSPRP